MADEESQVFVGVPPAPKYDFDFDDENGVAPPPSGGVRPDVPAKPAVVVGLQQANEARRQKRQTAAPPPSQLPVPPRAAQPPPAPPVRGKPLTQQPPMRAKGATSPPPVRGRPALPKPFEEPTRAMRDDELLRAVRGAPGPGRVPPDDEPLRGVRNAPGRNVFEEPTRMGGIDPAALFDGVDEGATSAEYPPKFLDAKTEHSPMAFEDEATRMANLDGSPRAKGVAGNDERTRAVDIRNDPSISDIDWDID
jgi:hypothetical protein